MTKPVAKNKTATTKPATRRKTPKGTTNLDQKAKIEPKVTPGKLGTLKPAPVPEGARFCQESSGISVAYTAGLSCLKPTAFVVRNSDPKQYAMCAGCTDHNVKNRGAKIVQAGEVFELYTSPSTPLPASDHKDTQVNSGGGVGEPPLDTPGDPRYGDESGDPRDEEEQDAPKGRAQPTKLSLGDELLAYVTAGMKKFKAKLEEEVEKILISERPASELVQVFANIRECNVIISDSVKSLQEGDSKLKDVILPEVFDRENLSSFTTTPRRDGDKAVRVTISTRFMASINPEQKEAALEWLRGNGMADLIQPVVNAGTLSAELKRLLEEGKEAPEELIKTYLKPGASLTKVTVKAKLTKGSAGKAETKSD